jgi:hypothetical protein
MNVNELALTCDVCSLFLVFVHMDLGRAVCMPTLVGGLVPISLLA